MASLILFVGEIQEKKREYKLVHASLPENPAQMEISHESIRKNVYERGWSVVKLGYQSVYQQPNLPVYFGFPSAEDVPTTYD